MNKEKLEQFLNNFNTKGGENFEVPLAGSLGLLALGDIGLIAWRLKRKESKDV